MTVRQTTLGQRAYTDTCIEVHHAFQALGLDEHRGAFDPAIWYLEPEFKDRVDLRQCWFPAFHGEVGGGVAGPVGRNHLAIEDVALAWMCDQVDGLLQFDEEQAKNILGRIEEDAEWGVVREKDPTGILYTLSIAGGSALRTPGSYHQDHANPWSHHCTTNETMHPSIKLLIDDKEAKYFPKALEERTSWNGISVPKWHYIDLWKEGQGAFWVRDPGACGPGELPRTQSSRAINIKEYVIQERDNMNNFEAGLLPAVVKEKLYRRNREELEQVRYSKIWSV